MDRQQLISISNLLAAVVPRYSEFMFHNPTSALSEAHRVIHRLEAADSIPRDLLHDFLSARGVLDDWVLQEANIPEVEGALKSLYEITQKALAEPIPISESLFPQIKDVVLRDILDRDFAEAKSNFEFGNWKSCIVLCGSILEAALYEYLLRKPSWTMDLTARSSLPKLRTGAPKDITSDALENQWRLVELVDFACSNGLVNSYKASTIHDTLRQPRNLIHPMKEHRKDGRVDYPTASVSLSMVSAILNELSNLSDPT